MTYEFYKVLHLVGLVTLFAALGALSVVSTDKRKPYLTLHGVASVVMLVAGFGLLARLGLARDMGLWVWAKIAIWVILGATPVLLRRKPNLAFPTFLVSLALGTLAAYLAIYKPGV